MILAFAAVWDTERPMLHHQARGHTLAYNPAIPERYDHFKFTYESRKSAVPYERLNWRTLAFVVDTPVPVSELKWAVDNVRGVASKIPGAGA